MFNRCSLAKISMVAELQGMFLTYSICCSLAKISMVAELVLLCSIMLIGCSLAKISMVAELGKLEVSNSEEL